MGIHFKTDVVAAVAVVDAKAPYYYTNEGSTVKGSTGDYLMIVHFAPGDPFLEGHDNFSGAKSCFMFAVFAFKI